MKPPEVRYARSGELSIAYQVWGEGAVNLVVGGPLVTHIEIFWEHPLLVDWYEQLGRFARCVMLDRRGSGASDPVEGPPSLEQQMDDLLAVLDAAGVKRAALLGTGDVARMMALFAATYPDRVAALVLNGPAAAGSDGLAPDVGEQMLDILENSWGTGASVRLFAPTLADDEAWIRWSARAERMSASPLMVRKMFRMALDSDVRAVLPNVRVPTLVLHRRGDRLVPIARGREVAELIPNARFVELEGVDPWPFVGDLQPWMDEVEEFLTGMRHARDPERVLSTVLFTDIVESTAHAARVGDSRWKVMLREHHAIVERELNRHRGRRVKTIGDGALITFDGPTRAVRAAGAMVREQTDLKLPIRAGLHTGEIELFDDDIGGLAVHIGARVGALAKPGEVLVSSTVRDLVVGSGLEFEDRGEHTLKGVPGKWRLFALSNQGPRSR
jgi:class 3 adenylate cyclase/pimeloyl-ACP methyl ester carboxylesterase